MTDLSQLDIQGLQDIKAQADQLIAEKQKEKAKDAYKQLEAIAANVGLSLEELIEQGSKGKRKRASYKVEPKYRNPSDASQTWTGRGRRPRWVEDALAAGRSLSSLEI